MTMIEAKSVTGTAAPHELDAIHKVELMRNIGTISARKMKSTTQARTMSRSGSMSRTAIES